MKINVYMYPSCTWVLDGGAFYCTHDETETVEYEVNCITMNESYECADKDCREQLEGSPTLDRMEHFADTEQDRMRDE